MIKQSRKSLFYLFQSLSISSANDYGAYNGAFPPFAFWFVSSIMKQASNVSIAILYTAMNKVDTAYATIKTIYIKIINYHY